MRIQKSKLKSASSSPVERLFRAFADRTRLRILFLLRDGELNVCDLVTALRAPQPTVSRHLAYLRELGLVRIRKQGLWMHYSLAPAASALHKKLLDCVGPCAAEIPEIQRDAERLNGSPRPGHAIASK